MDGGILCMSCVFFGGILTRELLDLFKMEEFGAPM